MAAMGGLLAALLASLVSQAVAQSCGFSVPDDQRRDCYRWDGANQATCNARGCLWCSETPGVPYCFIDDSVCPSTIPPNQRVDCHPEAGASPASCKAKGCLWCEAPGFPFCFSDPSVSQGGATCPSGYTDNERIDCHPDSGANEASCVARGCYWCSSSTQGVPWCFMPKSHGYYMNGNPTQTAKGWRVDLKRKTTPSWFGADINDIRVDVEFQTNQRIRVKIYDPATSRWEPPLNIESPASAATNTLYSITFSDSPSFNFRVTRKSDNTVIFDTSHGGLVFSDQFLQIAVKLPSSNVYGFGETEHTQLKHDMNWRSWGMFARDQPVQADNLYGVHPYYEVLENSGNAHGVLILNSNAQDVTMKPLPGYIYRTTGGILDLYMFLGPTPENVVEQYTEAIGRPVMPSYWSLGFHLSRYGYNNLQTMKDAVNRLRQYDIPHDVQHGDIDTMRDNLDFTYDTVRFAGLPGYVQELKQQGTRYIIILDPCIDIGQAPGYTPFDRGQSMNVWVTEGDGVTPAEGKVWPPNNVYFPDYCKPVTTDWWVQETVDFKQVLDFDGLWIDMNEPANFVTGTTKPGGCNYNNKYNNPFYKPRILGDVLPDKTLCMDYKDYMGDHYNTHSMFGWCEAEPSLKAARAATGKRSVVISRSTFPGAGKYATHWLGDNHARWDELHRSIIGSLEFNMFGIPFVGADICGFLGDSWEELCRRWMQLGSFYTFARNHNGMGWADHDPGLWPSVGQTSRDTLRIRYTLLPYLYTLFHEAHVYGRTVMRPLFHEFYTDSTTYAIDTQLLWGPALLISPALNAAQTSVNAYIPNGRWYSYYTGAEIAGGFYHPIPADSMFIPLHVRGGYVIPTQVYANSTMWSRDNAMGMIVALDGDEAAQGTLFWDEGDTVDTYENGQYFLASYSVTTLDRDSVLTSSVQNAGYSAGMGHLYFREIRIFGVMGAVSEVRVDGVRIFDYSDDPFAGTLIITDANVRVTSEFTISWRASLQS